MRFTMTRLSGVQIFLQETRFPPPKKRRQFVAPLCVQDTQHVYAVDAVG